MLPLAVVVVGVEEPARPVVGRDRQQPLLAVARDDASQIGERLRREDPPVLEQEHEPVLLHHHHPVRVAGRGGGERERRQPADDRRQRDPDRVLTAIVRIGPAFCLSSTPVIPSCACPGEGGAEAVRARACQLNRERLPLAVGEHTRRCAAHLEVVPHVAAVQDAEDDLTPGGPCRSKAGSTPRSASRSRSPRSSWRRRATRLPRRTSSSSRRSVPSESVGARARHELIPLSSVTELSCEDDKHGRRREAGRRAADSDVGGPARDPKERRPTRGALVADPGSSSSSRGVAAQGLSRYLPSPARRRRCCGSRRTPSHARRRAHGAWDPRAHDRPVRPARRPACALRRLERRVDAWRDRRVAAVAEAIARLPVAQRRRVELALPALARIANELEPYAPAAAA